MLLYLFRKHFSVESKTHPRTGHEGPGGEKIYSSTLPLTSTLDGSGWSTSSPGRATPWKDPVPIVEEDGRAAGPVLTGMENLAPRWNSSL